MPIPCGNEAISLDRAAHLRRDIDALEGRLSDPDTLIIPVWRDQNLILPGARPTLAVLPLARAGSLLEGEGELVWLGLLGRRGCFALDLSRLADPFERSCLAGQGEFMDIRNAMGAMGQDDAGLGAYARGILHWHSRNLFCGACGSRTEPRRGGFLRACTDARCGREHFPRTDPSVNVLVIDGDRCLLGRQPHWIQSVYSALAGFVEPGESLERAAVREVREEVGIDVGDPVYFSSQGWPFPASLMVGFSARALNTDIALGDGELEDARWYTRAELRDPGAHGFIVPGAYSLAGRMIEAFLEQQTG
jgi:NAD+ diphosphatase